MAHRREVQLVFANGIDPQIRHRIRYAFRVFCAIYGFRPIEDRCESRIYYGQDGDRKGLHLPAVYHARPLEQSAPQPRFVKLDGGHGRASCRFPLFHFRDGVTSPDWLAEIFEWLSGAHEYSVEARDQAGRIPYSATLHGRFGLDPETPYVGVAMQRLNDGLREIHGGDWPDRPVAPWTEKHAVVVAATHDLDFLAVSAVGSLRRWVKNLGIAAVTYRDASLLWSIARSGAFRLLRGQALLDGLPSLVAGERQRGIQSTFTVICRSGHRRDPGYRIEDPAVRSRLRRLADAGHEIGVHGSYCSLEKAGGLCEEYALLRDAGFRPYGGRQHWLRYAGTSLFDELRAAGAEYDCSVGYSNRPGFRSGAPFPYPPYDFGSEEPFPFLELPLVLMDTTLYNLDRRGGSWRSQCERILSQVRSYGWGGVSILWHDTVFSGEQLPPQMADLYWEIKGESDRWISAKGVTDLTWERYAEVALLPDRSSDGRS